MKKLKTFNACLLAFLMAFSLFMTSIPMSAFAEGEGTTVTDTPNTEGETPDEDIETIGEDEEEDPGEDIDPAEGTATAHIYFTGAETLVIKVLGEDESSSSEPINWNDGVSITNGATVSVPYNGQVAVKGIEDKYLLVQTGESYDDANESDQQNYSLGADVTLIAPEEEDVYYIVTVTDQQNADSATENEDGTWNIPAPTYDAGSTPKPSSKTPFPYKEGDTFTGKATSGDTWKGAARMNIVDGFLKTIGINSLVASCMDHPLPAPNSGAKFTYRVKITKANPNTQSLSYSVTFYPDNSPAWGHWNVPAGQAVYGKIQRFSYKGSRTLTIPTGYISAIKKSENQISSDWNLAGAKFQIYRDKACTDGATFSDDSPAIMVTNASGKTPVYEIDTGTYYVKELEAPAGHARSNTKKKIKVTTKKTESKPLVFTYTNKERYGDLKVQKIDKETGKAVPMGGATFVGTKFQIKYFGNANNSGTPERSWIFEIKDESQNNANLVESQYVSGDPLYKVDGKMVFPLGSYTITETEPPEGYLLNATSFEVKLSDSKGPTSTEVNVGTAGTQIPDQVIRSDLSFQKAIAAGERPLGNIPFVIKSKTTGEAHVVVTDPNGQAYTTSKRTRHTLDTNGNDVVITKDGKPVLNSDGFVDDSLLKWDRGTWFYKDREGNEATAVNNALGALPYDDYEITELPTLRTKGLEMIEKRFYSSKNEPDGSEYYGGSWKNSPEQPNYNMYKIRNELAPTNGADKYGFEPGTFVTYDVVIEHKTSAGTLTLDVSDEFTESPEYFSKPVVLEVKNATQNSISEDKNVVNITIGPKATAVVTYGALIKPEAKEYLAGAAKDSDSLKDGEDCNRKDKTNEPDEEDGYRNIAKTTNVSHEDEEGSPTSLGSKNDDAQTPVKEPKIGTTLTDGAAHKIVSGSPATLVDTISYEGLTPGKTYVFEGTLMVKDTEDPLVENGKEVTARSEEFVPTEANGTVDVTFTVDVNKLDGKELVAFETAYVTKDVDGSKPKDENGKETDKNEVAKHEDIDDEAQTVEVPGYKMYKVRRDLAPAKDAKKYGFEPGSTVLYDVFIQNTSKTALLKMDVTDQFTEHPEYFTTPEVVEVKNATQNSISENKNKVNISVEAGKTATITYAATIKENAKEYLAKAAKDSDSLKDGKDVNRTEKTNKPDDKDGYKNVAKTDNVTPYDPKKPDEPLKPLDPKEDEAQTPVKKPEIGTYLADKANKKKVTAGKTTLVDTVAYKGLTPGQKYAVVGELMVKDTGNPRVEDGKPVTAVGTFTPKKTDGSTEVTFIVNTKGLEGKELVAFETAYNITGTDITKDSTPDEVSKKGKKVAEHKDIKDKAQTIQVIKKGSPDTGDKTSIFGLIGLFAASVAALAVMIRRKRISAK